jgi:AraC-like DNA-binding protein
MILRQMPAISDAAYRRWFYARWGRENCIVWARTRSISMPPFQQRLSIKAAWGGREEYLIDGRPVAVDDDTFMILNDGRTYGSRLRSATPVTSFAIFFRPGMPEEVERCHVLGHEALLEDSWGAHASGFAESPRPHDARISPVLRFIRHHVEAGLDDEHWYEEQLYFLLGRMQALRALDRAALLRIPAARAGTRREIARRLGLCLDFMHTHYAEPIGLARIAAAAHLSPYHCLRLFRATHGLTPGDWLRRRRLLAARRLRSSGRMSLQEIATAVGIESRSTLFRLLRTAPRQGTGADGTAPPAP